MADLCGNHGVIWWERQVQRCKTNFEWIICLKEVVYIAKISGLSPQLWGIPVERQRDICPCHDTVKERPGDRIQTEKERDVMPISESQTTKATSQPAFALLYIIPIPEDTLLDWKYVKVGVWFKVTLINTDFPCSSDAGVLQRSTHRCLEAMQCLILPLTPPKIRSDPDFNLRFMVTVEKWSRVWTKGFTHWKLY